MEHENEERVDIILTDAPSEPLRPIWLIRAEKAFWWPERQNLLTAANIIVSGALMLLTAGLVGVAIWQGKLTRDVAIQGQKQFAWSERPILVLTEAKVTAVLLAENGNISYNMEVTTNDKGQGAAENSLLLTNFRASGDNSVFYPETELSDTCHSADARGKVGELIPSGEKLELKRQTFEPGSHIRDLILNAKAASNGSRSLLTRIAVCVTYTDQLGTEFHHAGRLYELTLTVTPAQYQAISDHLTVPLLFSNSASALVPFHPFNGLSD